MLRGLRSRLNGGNGVAPPHWVCHTPSPNADSCCSIYRERTAWGAAAGGFFGWAGAGIRQGVGWALSAASFTYIYVQLLFRYINYTIQASQYHNPHLLCYVTVKALLKNSQSRQRTARLKCTGSRCLTSPEFPGRVKHRAPPDSSGKWRPADRPPSNHYTASEKVMFAGRGTTKSATLPNPPRMPMGS